MQPPPPPPGKDVSWRNTLLQEPPTEEEWEKLRETHRADEGHQQWLRYNAAKVDQRWSEAHEPSSAGSASSRGKGGKPRAAEQGVGASAQPHGTTWRTVAAARRWVQSLDSGPSFGEAKHLWYLAGRPVMARPKRGQTVELVVLLFLLLFFAEMSAAGPLMKLLRNPPLGLRKRPTLRQVLVITYAGASDTEWLPYLASIFAPLVPVWIWGRDAEASQCKKQHAVWHVWHDVIRPFIECCRVPTDTLFIIAEADWCMSLAHSEACEKYMQETNDLWVECEDPLPKEPARTAQPTTDTEAAEEDPEVERPAGKGGRGHAKRQRTQKTGRKGAGGKGSRELHEWYHAVRTRRPAPAAGAPAPSPPMLQDIVQACNVAAHLEAGDLVWLSYADWQQGRKTLPGHGSTAVAVTRFGMDLVSQCMAQSQPGHFVLRLLQWLETAPSDQPESSKLLQGRSSYVWNGYGGYRTHLSGCDKKAGVRQATWVAPQQEWTRSVATTSKLAATERWLVRFGAKGDAHSNKLAVLKPKTVLNDKESVWTTYFPRRLMKDDRPDYDLIEREVANNIARRRASASAQPSTEPSAPADLEEAPRTVGNQIPPPAEIDTPRTVHVTIHLQSLIAATGPRGPGADGDRHALRHQRR